MSRGGPPSAGIGHVVYMTLPLLSIDSRDRLVAALHAADRKMGVAVGREGDAMRFILITDEANERAARQRATRLLEAAAEHVGLTHEIANRVDIDRVAQRTLSPGRPRRVSVSPPLAYRVIPLPDGRVLHVGDEGPLGNWTGYVDDADDRAWAGRDLPAVLSELLELPHGKKDDWVYDLIRRLAGRETAFVTRYACPCCDCFTLGEPPSGTFDICPVCCWEDDDVQFADLDYTGGANKSSLREARELPAHRRKRSPTSGKDTAAH